MRYADAGFDIARREAALTKILMRMSQIARQANDIGHSNCGTDGSFGLSFKHVFAISLPYGYKIVAESV